LLFVAVFYRVCHMFFSQKVQSRNWFTITMYFIMIFDLLIGCLVLVTIVKRKDVYNSDSRSVVPTFTKVILLT